MRVQSAVAGRLVSRQFLREVWRVFPGRLGESSAESALRQLARWRKIVHASLGPASGLTALHDVATRGMFRLLGFELIAASAPEGLRVSVASGRRTGPLPVVAGPWTSRLDALTRRAVQEAVARGARWAFCFNGQALRLVDADRPYARRFLEFDLASIDSDDEAARLLWAMLRAASFERRPPRQDTLLAAIVTASDAHAERVADSLQHGVRSGLESLAHALARSVSRRRITPAVLVEQSLTIVYRLLFLLFAEARSLVPVWNPVYRESYSVDGLRGACDCPAEAVGLWDALQAISRLAHTGCSTRELHVTAFNSQLFSPERAPLIEHAHVDDETMAKVLRALTDAPAPDGPVRVAYGDLGVEQLGTIYERLLDVTPALESSLQQPMRRTRTPDATSDTRRTEDLVRVRRPSLRRKESGTFYTPGAMAEYLVRETLGPLVRDRSSEEILRLRVLDPAMGSGAFLVAACRFLADACAEADRRDGREPRTGPAAARARLRRFVAQRCLYGVDLNPVAVQLARLSLWLATLAADAPLTFLDHHLCVGDSLVGASIEDLVRGWPATARTAVKPDGRERSLFDQDEVTSVLQEAMPVRLALAAPDDTAAIVRAKEQSLSRSLTEGSLSRWMALADLWCARWFWPVGQAPPASAWQALADRVLGGDSALPLHIAEPALRQARVIAQARRFLHWRLRFPEVFFADDGRPRPDAGFDAIVGNPPWDMVRGDAGDAAMRNEARETATALGRFVRDSRRYRCGGEAHLNRYQLFTERALSCLRHGGRLGLVVPWGLASDVASAPLRRTLFERCDTETLVGFDNGEGLFPIHRSVRFALVIAATGRPTTRIACRLGERTLDVLERPGAEGAGRVMLTPEWLRRVSGEGLEAPYVRTRRDVALVDRLTARWPAMGSAAGWAAAFGRELNATDDRALFEDGQEGLPVIDGRHLAPFAVHVDRSVRVVGWSRARALRRRLPSISRRRLAYRDVASPANRVTLIAAVLPPDVVSTHTLFCLKTPLDDEAQYALCALMNSLVANYLVRLRVSTHVTAALVSRLPIPNPVRGGGAFDALSAGARALEQAARSGGQDGRSARDDYGVCERSPAWASLQGLAARVYGVTRDELDYILSTFPLVDPSARRAAFDAFLEGTTRGPGNLSARCDV